MSTTIFEKGMAGRSGSFIPENDCHVDDLGFAHPRGGEIGLPRIGEQDLLRLDRLVDRLEQGGQCEIDRGPGLALQGRVIDLAFEGGLEDGGGAGQGQIQSRAIGKHSPEVVIDGNAVDDHEGDVFAAGDKFFDQAVQDRQDKIHAAEDA